MVLEGDDRLERIEAKIDYIERLMVNHLKEHRQRDWQMLLAAFGWLFVLVTILLTR